MHKVGKTLILPYMDCKTTYTACKYRGGSSRGKELFSSDNRDSAFDTAEKDAKAVIESLNQKADENNQIGGIPFSSKFTSCHMISDREHGTIEIRQDIDGLLMYYYDISASSNCISGGNS